MNGKHVEHWLNGQKIVEYEFGSPDWIKRKEGSKWKDAKGYGLASKGHIDLQDHGHVLFNELGQRRQATIDRVEKRRERLE